MQEGGKTPPRVVRPESLRRPEIRGFGPRCRSFQKCLSSSVLPATRICAIGTGRILRLSGDRILAISNEGNPTTAGMLATPPVVRGLSASDFRVFDNGTEQKINPLEESDFSWQAAPPGGGRPDSRFSGHLPRNRRRLAATICGKSRLTDLQKGEEKSQSCDIAC